MDAFGYFILIMGHIKKVRIRAGTDLFNHVQDPSAVFLVESLAGFVKDEDIR